jgi:putative ABC transport system ATP-binding protein
MSTIGEPLLLLLDEHTAALDPSAAEKVMDITHEVARSRNITTLMITHNIHQALRFGARIVMLREGRIVLDISGKEKAEMTPSRLMALYPGA